MMAAVSAVADPVSPANRVPVATMLWASPPRTLWSTILQKPISLSVMPDSLMRSPAKMKKGMAMSGKDEDALYICCVMMLKGSMSVRNR